MLLGLATYLYGYRYLPARVERRKFEGTRLTAAERRIVYTLIAVILITIFQSTAFYQVYNVSSIWIQHHVALDLGGFRIPVPWFLSVNSVFSILGVPLVLWIWRRQALRRREPNDLAKIGTGAWIAAASNLILVTAIFVSGDSLVHPIVPFLYSAGLGISFLYYWPTLLALVSAGRAGQSERHPDGTGLYEPVRFEHPHRLDRRLLRENDARRVLGDARGHRRRRRSARHALRSSPQSSALSNAIVIGKRQNIFSSLSHRLAAPWHGSSER